MYCSPNFFSNYFTVNHFPLESLNTQHQVFHGVDILKAYDGSINKEFVALSSLNNAISSNLFK